VFLQLIASSTRVTFLQDSIRLQNGGMGALHIYTGFFHPLYHCLWRHSGDLLELHDVYVGEFYEVFGRPGAARALAIFASFIIRPSRVIAGWGHLHRSATFIGCIGATARYRTLQGSALQSPFMTSA
jgi:hypothetical protein